MLQRLEEQRVKMRLPQPVWTIYPVANNTFSGTLVIGKLTYWASQVHSSKRNVKYELAEKFLETTERNMVACPWNGDHLLHDVNNYGVRCDLCEIDYVKQIAPAKTSDLCFMMMNKEIAWARAAASELKSRHGNNVLEELIQWRFA